MTSFAPQGSWFARTGFVPDDLADEVSGQLDDYCAALRRLCASEPVTLCLSGSLARGEPAVRMTPSGPRLGSDVDLVAVMSPPDAHPRLAPAVRDEMNRRFPDIITTIFVVDGARLGNVRSLFGRDFWAGSRCPVTGGPPLGPFAVPPVGRREYGEVIVHQLTSLVLLPATGVAPGTAAEHRAGRAFLRSKLALEALRALVDPDPARPVCFSDLLDDARGARARAMAGRETVETLVRHRELCLDLSGIDVDRLVNAVIRELLGAAASPEPDRVTLAALGAFAASTEEFLALFQTSILLLFVLRQASPGPRTEAATLLRRAIGQLRDDELREGFAAKRAIAQMSPADIAADAMGDAAVTGALRLIRLDYYHHLGPHNFGIRPRPGYDRATASPLAEQDRRHHD